MQTTIDVLAAWLRAHDDFVLIGHVMPDGDAVGSCVAAALALRALGKRAYVCLPGEVPKIYQKYPHADEVVVQGGETPFAAQTAFALDVSEQARMGGAEGMFLACAARAMIDHHPTNPGFGDVFYIDGEAAATGEIVAALIEALGVEIDRDMATWLFIALSTDSGHFSFSNTRPETFETAAKLLRTGIDLATLSRELNRTRTRARTKLLGLVLSQLETSEDGQMAWARLTDDMLLQAGASREDNEGAVNYLLEIENVEFAMLAERREGATKFSLRSKNWLNVAEQVAVPLGGGGHARAAGCTVELPMDEAISRVLALARQALDRH